MTTRAPDDRTLPFFAFTLGFTWLIQLPCALAKAGVIAGPPERWILPAALGGFGPVLGAVLFARRAPGGVRSLGRPRDAGRVGLGWYAVALGGFIAVWLAGRAVYALLGGHAPVQWLYLPENAQHVAAMLLVPVTEEPGWRGYALPRLERRYGPLEASLRLGVAWAAWHTVMFYLQGATVATFVLGMVSVVAGSVVFSWLYRRTRGSLLVACVAHASLHLNNPFRSFTAGVAPFVIDTLAVCVAAVVLVLADRAAWRGGAAREEPLSREPRVAHA